MVTRQRDDYTASTPKALMVASIIAFFFLARLVWSPANAEALSQQEMRRATWTLLKKARAVPQYEAVIHSCVSVGFHQGTCSSTVTQPHIDGRPVTTCIVVTTVRENAKTHRITAVLASDPACDDDKVIA